MSTIPRILHLQYFWQTPTAWMLANVAEWRAVNPGWDVRFETQLPELPAEILSVLHDAPTPRFRADIVRYWTLLEHGGVYADIDTRPVRHLEALLAPLGPECDGWVSRHRGHARILDNFFLAGKAGSTWWRQCIERCCDKGKWRKPSRYFGGFNAFPDLAAQSGENIAVLDQSATWEIQDPREYAELFAVPRVPLADPVAILKHYRACGQQTLPVLSNGVYDELAWEDLGKIHAVPGHTPRTREKKHVTAKPVPPPKAVPVKLRNGDLYHDPGGPLPDDRDGYARDDHNPHLLRKLRDSDFNEVHRGCCRGL